MTDEPRENRFPPELISQALVDRSRYGSAQEYRAARAAAWAALAAGGMTLTEIGEAVGISRERVRQILRQEGYTARLGQRGPISPGPIEVVELLRKTPVRSVGELAERAGMGDSGVRVMLRELGIDAASERLFRMRTRELATENAEKMREKMLAAIKEFAEATGATPGVDDAIAGHFPFAHTSVVRYFGTWNNAIRAAGLKARGVGESKKSAKRRKS